MVIPALSETARQAGVRIPVIVEISIDADGRVTAAEVLRPNPLLEAAALRAVREWRFEPALLNGKPVSVTMTEVVRFEGQ
jgi:TonB family protein